MKRNAIPAAVYVLEGEQKVKIGRSKNPEHRAKILAASHHGALRLVYSTNVRHDASFVEAQAHKSLGSDRAGGEWFNVSTDDAIGAIEGAIEVANCAGCRPRPIKIRRARPAKPARTRVGKKAIRVRISRELHKQIKIAAIRANQTMQEWVEQALREAMTRDRKRKGPIATSDYQ